MKKFWIIILFLSLANCAFANTAENVILPKPLSVQVNKGIFRIDDEISFKGDFKLLDQSRNLVVNTLLENFGIHVKDKSKTQIFLSRDKGIVKEGYVLDIKAEKITISASTEIGAFYAFQSLFQLIEASRTEEGYFLQAQKIKDSPRFEWRAYMLDEARNFMGKDVVYNLLDEMAMLKMNVFHWHLVDDSGWRLEIKKYPKLIEVGSKRADTHIGGWKSEKRTGIPHSGYYTQDEIKDIVKYAKERHIRIVPEIEMPGHASAAIASYPWLGIQKDPIEVPVRFGQHLNCFDVIDPKVIGFLEDVLTEVIDLFDSDIIHIGGDEVRFDQWENDPAMIAYKEKKGYDSFMDIQIEFTNKMSRFVQEKGGAVMGWIEHPSKFLNAKNVDPENKLADNVIVQFWKGNVSEWAEAAENGYRIVNSLNKKTYLDFSQKDISLEKAYTFNPIPEDLAEEYWDNVIGLGCQMWTEWTLHPVDVYTHSFPRIAAYAETGWTVLENKNYDDFLCRLNPFFTRWKNRGIPFYDNSSNK